MVDLVGRTNPPARSPAAPGTPEARWVRVEAAVEALRRGELVVVVDAADRENEGDLVMAAEHVTPAAVNFMATYGRGLICVPMSRDRLDQLGISPMVSNPTDPRKTAFHVGVDVRYRTTTGISAADRARTIAALADPGSSNADFSQPGHVFPLAYREGGVLRRAGHTEASVDLVRLAGLTPAAVICEIAGPDGEMARPAQLARFCAEHGLVQVEIGELIAYRRSREQTVVRAGQARLPTEAGEFTVLGYRDRYDGLEHVAVVMGDLRAAEPPLIRIHSECLTGDALGSDRCDCGQQLRLSLRTIAAEGRGAVVYLHGHEGRGIGLIEKLRAYELQDAGLDTVEANLSLGHPADGRGYEVAVGILRELGVTALRLLTNNPAKCAGVERLGLTVTDRVPLLTPPTADNIAYLRTKRSRLGHLYNVQLAPLAVAGGTGD